MLLNGLKLFNEGVRNEALWKYIRDNTRVRAWSWATSRRRSLPAELVDCASLSRNCRKPTARTMVMQATRRLMDYTEGDAVRRRSPRSRMRTTWPRVSSTMTAVTAASTSPLKVTVRARGDVVEVDTTGSSPQGADGLQRALRRFHQGRLLFRFPRAPARYLHARREYIPQNEEFVSAGGGHLAARRHLQPDLAGGAEARFAQIQRLFDLIIKALALVLPDKCAAGNAAVLSFAAYSGVRPGGDYWVFLEVNEGRDGRASALGRAGYGRGVDAQHAQ